MISKIYPVNAAENPDFVLEQAIGNYNNLLILGWGKDGEFDPRSTLNLSVGDILELMEIFKFKLVRGDYDKGV